MRRIVPVALSLLLAPAALAQSPKDFSGRWVAIEPASVAGHELRIIQDDETLTLEQVRIDSRQGYDNFGRRVGDGKGEFEATTYRLDGKPTIASLSADDPQQVRSSVRWDKDRLVLSDLYSATGLRFVRTLALDARGRLVLERRGLPPDHDPHSASRSVLEPTRIVFEKR